MVGAVVELEFCSGIAAASVRGVAVDRAAVVVVETDVAVVGVDVAVVACAVVDAGTVVDDGLLDGAVVACVDVGGGAGVVVVDPSVVGGGFVCGVVEVELLGVEVFGVEVSGAEVLGGDVVVVVVGGEGDSPFTVTSLQA